MPRATAVLLALAASVSAAPASREPASDALKRAIDAVVERREFAPAFWGIEVRSLKTGRVLYSRNARKNLKPASTFKLLTTAAAVDAFAPDERIRTTVETAGRLEASGRLIGDVYLVGRGDANLSGRFNEGRVTAPFEELADQLAAAGVRRIEGQLIGHEGLFKGDRRGEDWTWDDLIWWYGAEVSALSFNDNCADLRATAGERVGDPVVIERKPVSGYYSVVSTATTSAAGTKSDLTLVRDLGANVIKISGTHPLGEKAWEGNVALEDPARYSTVVFSEVLRAKGIELAGEIATSGEPLPAGLTTLAVHESPPFSDTLKIINKRSQNLHVELLLRLLGRRVKGEGSVAAGHDAVQEFLKRSGAEAADMKDAAGLSRSDLLQPHEIVNLLVAMDRHPRAQIFRDSLPIAGVDGTLRNRMKGTPAEKRILAKTGSIRHINSLAGYATRRDGERLALSIVLDNDTSPPGAAIAAIDEIANALVR